MNSLKEISDKFDVDEWNSLIEKYKKNKKNMFLLLLLSECLKAIVVIDIVKLKPANILLLFRNYIIYIKMITKDKKKFYKKFDYKHN